MSVRSTALAAGTVLTAPAAVAWLLLVEIGRVEGPGDASAIRDTASVEGFDRVAAPPDAAVLAGPPGTTRLTDRLSGPGAPRGRVGTNRRSA